MKRKLIIFITLLFISFNVTSQDKIKTYKTDVFSIEYPDNWRLDTTGRMNSSLILFSELKEGDLLNENINLMVQDLTNQGFTMESFVKLSENQVLTLAKNGKILKSEFDKDKNHHVMIWSGNVSGRDLKFKQCFLMKNEIVYVLTLTTLPVTFDDYIEVGDEILNSFKLK